MGISEKIGLNPKEAAAMLGISPTSFYRLRLDDKSFPKGARIGRCIRWTREDLERWFSKRQAKNRD